VDTTTIAALDLHMISPTVTELPRRLEPISRDTFIDRGVNLVTGPPPGSAPRALPRNVTELRRADGRVRGLTLAAA
jgi:hypothetical protein